MNDMLLELMGIKADEVWGTVNCPYTHFATTNNLLYKLEKIQRENDRMIKQKKIDTPERHVDSITN